MKLKLTKTVLKNNSAVYDTVILGAKVRLSSKLVDALRAADKFGEEITVDDKSVSLFGSTRESNGKTYVNLYLTVKQEKADAKTAADEPLPF